MTSAKRISGCPIVSTRHHSTPCLLIDRAELGNSISRLKNAFPGVGIHYAVKCNSHPGILSQFAEAGLGFEIASQAELDCLSSMRVDASRMMCLHPIKSPDFVAKLGEACVRTLAADSVAEVRKIAAIAPASRILIRLDVGGAGSLVPLGGKFGCRPADTTALARVVREHGLDFAGVTLHVGSQCQSMLAWKESLDKCRAVCAQLADSGSPCEVISLGGGLPVPYTSGVPPLQSIGELVMRADLASVGAPGCRLTIEPGRALVATAGTMVTSVVGTAEREGVAWVYVDAGIFHGLMEFLPAAGGFRLPIVLEESKDLRELHPSRIAGPTCDSLDVLPREFSLPRLTAGDRIAFAFAGAYSSAVATSFNGFVPPHTVFVE